jgi:hypothetical protein
MDFFRRTPKKKEKYYVAVDYLKIKVYRAKSKSF